MDEDLDALSLRSDDTLRLVSEDPEDPTNLRVKLREELDSIDSAGTFASFTSLDVDPDFVDPKIEIDNVGVINTPLVPEDVERLTGACHPSPFGKGDQTIVDPSVRSSWELDATQFRITNPSWQNFLNKLLNMVSMVLGVDSDFPVTADLYKMLLYGKGAHFKPHQEYSDVQHEVTEVTAGHRWVLTYNLSRPALSPSCSLRREYPLLKRTLASWRKACDREDFWKEEHFVYVLEHKYTQASLAFDKLKGKDLAQARALQDHCEAHGFCVFVANICEMKYGGASDEPVRHVHGPRRRRGITFHRIENIVETEVRLTRVVDFAGRAVAGNIVVGDDESDRLLKRGRLGSDDPDAADYTPYTGNEGRDATHWYREAAIVLMPWEYVPTFLTTELFLPPWHNWSFDEDNNSFTFKLEDTIEFFLSELHKQPDRAVIREAVEKFCSLYLAKRISEKPSNREEVADADTMLQAAIKCDNPKIFEVAFEGLKDGRLSNFALKALSSWLFEKGFSYLEPSLSRFVTLHRSIHQVYRLCSGIMQPTEAFYEDRKRKSDESGLSVWISEKLNGAMSQPSDVNAQDGEALAKILIFADDRDSVLSSVMNAVQRNISNTPFAMGFLVRIEIALDFDPLRTKVDARLPYELGIGIYKEVVAQCIQHLDLRSAEQKSGEIVPATGGKRSRHFPSGSSTPEINSRDPDVHGMHLIDLFNVLHTNLHADNLVDKLFEKVQAEAKWTDVDFFPERLTDFLHHVGDEVYSLGMERVRPLFRNVIESYLIQGIGQKYEEPSWSRPRINCPCGSCYCRAIDQFLSDPKKTDLRLPLRISAQRHLRKKLADRGPAIKMETERGIHGTNPATLCITKLPDEQYYEAQRLKRRHEEFDRQMKDLEDVVNLRELLGDKYNYLVKKRALWWAESKTSGT